MANTKVPSHLTEGLAKDDLSNVTPATGLAALGAAKSDLSNVDPAAGRAALGAAAAAAVPALPLAVNQGGTGATTADAGRVALGAVSVDCGDSLGSFVWAAPADLVAAGATFKNYGETVAGSLLVPAGQTGNTQPRSSTTPTGTYRCLGYAHNNEGAGGYPATLYQKISMT